MKGNKMAKRANWNGVLDVDVLKKFKIRVWSKKEFPIVWTGEKADIINYNEETGNISAHIGNKTFVFNMSSAIIQVQNPDGIKNAEDPGQEPDNENVEKYAAKMHKATSRKKGHHNK